MEWNFLFIFNSVLLGVGLTMDAFSVSLANGLNEPDMRLRKMCLIAGVFGLFQAVMPMTGWICVHTIVEHFKAFERFIPIIALILLSYIGGKMVFEGFCHKDIDGSTRKLNLYVLIVQGIATSIDALSVGFTISEYNLFMAFVCSIIIATVTFVFCMSGLFIGKRFGTKFSNKAEILGGIILILIGIEIFIGSIL
ncbi:MAG: manganese efflux pump [Clostridia bacterium]|nr:manganese efflux pump [Clostridia bacterium]